MYLYGRRQSSVFFFWNYKEPWQLIIHVSNICRKRLIKEFYQIGSESFTKQWWPHMKRMQFWGMLNQMCRNCWQRRVWWIDANTSSSQGDLIIWLFFIRGLILTFMLVEVLHLNNQGTYYILYELALKIFSFIHGDTRNYYFTCVKGSWWVNFSSATTNALGCPKTSKWQNTTELWSVYF